MGHIKAGQTATLAIHSSRSSPLPPPPLQHAQSQQELPRRRSSDAAEPGAPRAAANGKRHPSDEAETAARHRHSQADIEYQQRDLERKTAAVTFAEPEEAASAAGERPGAASASQLVAEPDAGAEAAATAASGQSPAGAAWHTSAAPSGQQATAKSEPTAEDDAAALLEVELPEESAWLQELARERERDAVPWLRAAVADETPVSQRFRPVRFAHTFL